MISRLEDLDLEGKTVLVKISLDVPLRDGKVSDDSRLWASEPTIKYLLGKDCKIIVCGHIGRPKGKIVPELSSKPVAEALEKVLGQQVNYLSSAYGEDIMTAIEEGGLGSVWMLENLRFYPGEEECSEDHAKKLAALADCYVNDEYPNAHRKHACDVLVPKLLPSAAGISMIKEYETIVQVRDNPEKPLVVIIGGAKKDKIGVVDNMLGLADNIILGGVLANTFLKASGVDVKGSKCDETSQEIAGEYLRDAEEKFMLPEDVIVAASFAEDAEHKECSLDEIPDGWMIMDIGTGTRKKYAEVLGEAETIIWGGPIGVFEWKAFSEGTKAVAQAAADSNAYSLVAGGDSGDAVKELGFADKISHVSIGGGATLSLIAGDELPAFEALNTTK